MFIEERVLKTILDKIISKKAEADTEKPCINEMKIELTSRMKKFTASIEIKNAKQENRIG